MATSDAVDRNMNNPFDAISDMNKEGPFIQNLRKEHGGEVPQWSLQQYINPFRVFDNQRCQFRVYAIQCNDHIYIYDTVEVRVPRWDSDLDSIIQLNHTPLVFDGTKLENSSDGVQALTPDSREYNYSRNKTLTNRYLLEELTEQIQNNIRSQGVAPAEDMLSKSVFHNVCKNSLLLLQKDILLNQEKLKKNLIDYVNPYPIQQDVPDPDCKNSQIGVSDYDKMNSASSDKDGFIYVPNTLSQPNYMSVVGIDLVVSNQFPYNVYIVEYNNNPAMPGVDKHMTDKYRQHLFNMMTHLLYLGGIVTNKDNLNSIPASVQDMFIKVW